MKVGDLVKVIHSKLGGPLRKDSTGVIVNVKPPTLMFAYEVISVVFSDGSVLEDMPSRWFEVISEGS